MSSIPVLRCDRLHEISPRDVNGCFGLLNTVPVLPAGNRTLSPGLNDISPPFIKGSGHSCGRFRPTVRHLPECQMFRCGNDCLSLGRALETANPLGHAFSERHVADPLLFAGGKDHAPLQGADLAATRPADFGQLPHAPHSTSRERPGRRRASCNYATW